jgi:hypothetical protein
MRGAETAPMIWFLLFIQLAVVTTLVTPAAPAFGQPMAAPTYAVGDSWAYSDGRQIAVVKVEDGAPIMTGPLAVCPACVVHYDRNLAIRKVTDAAGKSGGGRQDRLPRPRPRVEVLRVSARGEEDVELLRGGPDPGKAAALRRQRGGRGARRGADEGRELQGLQDGAGPGRAPRPGSPSSSPTWCGSRPARSSPSSSSPAVPA